MSAIDPTLLAEGAAVPDEDTLLAADPSGAWAALVQLRADAIEDAPTLAPVPDLEAVARWSAETPEVGDEAVRQGRGIFRASKGCRSGTATKQTCPLGTQLRWIRARLCGARYPPMTAAIAHANRA